MGSTVYSLQRQNRPTSNEGSTDRAGIREINDPNKMRIMPTTILMGMGSRKKINAKIGASAGLKKKTSDAVKAEVASIAMK